MSIVHPKYVDRERTTPLNFPSFRSLNGSDARTTSIVRRQFSHVDGLQNPSMMTSLIWSLHGHIVHHDSMAFASACTTDDIFNWYNVQGDKSLRWKPPVGWVPTVLAATYPGRMVEHLKFKSTGVCCRPDVSPCTLDIFSKLDQLSLHLTLTRFQVTTVDSQTWFFEPSDMSASVYGCWVICT